MCELLGISSKEYANINFSFGEFCYRGGGSNIHKDGWGVAFSQPSGRFRIFVEEKPSFDSKLAGIVQKEYFKSNIAISHIRRATVGGIEIMNNQPFSRLLWDDQWVFAHNGDLPQFRKEARRFNSLGDTDSERIFCYILDVLYQKCKYKESDPFIIANILDEISNELSSYGVLNFLLTNGTFIFAYGHSSLNYVKRVYPFSSVVFRDTGIKVDLADTNNQSDQIVVIATRALTVNEDWVGLASKKVYVFKQGNILE